MSRLLTLLLVVSTVNGIAQKTTGDPAEIEKILRNVRAFSQHVMASDYERIADAYTVDGKLFPNNRDIIQGREAIIKLWTLPEGVETTHHKISPEEIKVVGDEAWDYGYYEGRTKRKDGSEVDWRGKYVIVWRKEDGDWKMYLDIWNRIQ